MNNTASEKVTFNELVYALVRHIPPGRVSSYGRIARLLGVERGARAVGWAMSALKHGVHDVPWHRVVNAQGRISIKGSPEGAAEQRARLEAEGVVFDERGHIDMDVHLWRPVPPEVEAIICAARGGIAAQDTET